MATCFFRSSLAFRLQTFLETRRAAGRDDVGTQKILIYLDRFLMSELQSGKPISREIVEHWFKSTEHLSTGTRINRISILRQFCLYLSHFDPRTCIVHRSFLPRRARPVPHIYTRNEVRQIMAASKAIGPTEGLRPLLFATLIGLLYSTGLRIGEALKLAIGDLDFKRRLIHIREGKFKKSRYVPISKSTADHLAAYLILLQPKCCPIGALPAMLRFDLIYFWRFLTARAPVHGCRKRKSSWKYDYAAALSCVPVSQRRRQAGR